TATYHPDASITYVPAQDYTGPDSFTYTVLDFGTTNGVEDDKTATATVNITVTAVNHPPVANNDNYSLDAGTTLNVAAPGVLANDTDADGDPFTAILGATPAHGTISFHPDGSFTYTPV